MGNKNLIMVISHYDFLRQFLESLLNKHGYETIFFANEQQIPDTLYRSIPELVIIAAKDKAAPVCGAVRSLPDLNRIPIIILSESNDSADRADSFSAGCTDYVVSPFDEMEILSRIGIHLENKRSHQWLREKITEQTKELTEAQMETIIAMAELAESRDSLTSLHLDRIRGYCRVLAKKLSETDQFHREISQEFTDLIYHASALHDIGKIGVRDGILNKYGKLTDEEFEIIASHTTKGSMALESVIEKHPNSPFIRMSVEIIRFHHEKWNGKGYPLKISGETIPLPARIMALADVYDAVRSKRSYKEAKTHEEAVEEILNMKGVHLDPSVVDSFIEAQGEFVEIYEQTPRG
ncbi:MAG: HD domain-containing protein [Synergistaceae bacterium]|nr:HD domain-containing protein [Synergistaceae bacterium]